MRRKIEIFFILVIGILFLSCQQKDLPSSAKRSKENQQKESIISKNKEKLHEYSLSKDKKNNVKENIDQNKNVKKNKLPNLRVEGIIAGEKPITVINGEVFKEGDEIKGVVISEITEDKVYFQQGRGTFSRRIEGDKSKQEDEEDSYGRISARENNRTTQSSVPPPQSYLDAKDYYQQASKLAMDNLGKAKIFYKKAIRNAQWALSKVFDRKRREMKNIIKKSRDVMSAFEEGKREAKYEGKVTIGMNKREVKSILGKPSKINKSQYGQWGDIQEQWVYRPYGPYLYFEDGVLTSYQD